MATYEINQDERTITILEDGKAKAICDYLLWNTSSDSPGGKHEGLLVCDCDTLRSWILERFDWSVDNDGDFIFPIGNESYEVAI